MVLVTAPATLALNTAELRVIASLAGTSFGWAQSLRISLVGSLANLLPVPGAAAVRTTALVRDGVKVGRAAEASLLAAGVWAAAATLVTGIALAAAGAGLGALLVVIAGIGLLAVAVWRSVRRAGSRSTVTLLAVETATLMVSGLRVALGYGVLRQTVGAAEALVIGSSQVVAALIGLAPGGLGLRELIAGGLATLVDRSADIAIAATVVDRLTGQIGLALTIAVVAFWPGSEGGTLWRLIRRPADVGPAPGADA